MHSPQPSSTPRPRAPAARLVGPRVSASALACAPSACASVPCTSACAPAGPPAPVPRACAPAVLLRTQLGRVVGTVTVLQYSPCPASVTIQSIVLRYTPAQQPVAIHWLSCNTIFLYVAIQNQTTAHPRLQYNLLYCNTTSSQAYLFLQYNF